MSKVKGVVIGLDGLEPSLAARYMPRFSNMADASFSMLSTLPPDSALSWPVAYTGLGLQSLLKTTPFDVQEYKSESSNLEHVLARRVLGRAYWDRISQENHKVCLLFPYPLDKIVGEMTCPSKGMAAFLTENDGLRVLSETEEPDIVAAISKIWEGIEQRVAYKKGSRQAFDQDMELFARKIKTLYKVLETEYFDFTYFYSDILEWQHFMWHNREFLAAMYNRIEAFLLNLLRGWGDVCFFIIHSDHGFAARPSHLLNIPKVASSVFPKPRRVGNLLRDWGFRFLIPEITCMFGLEKVMLLELYPRFKKKLRLRFKDDLLQMLEIKRDEGSGILYDPSFELRDFCGFYVESDDSLKGLLTSLTRYTETVYDAVNDCRLRDIMVRTSNVAIRLKEYCTFFNHSAPMKVRNPQARIIPGTHGLYTKFYVFSGPYEVRKMLQDGPALLTDIAPTLLGIYGISDQVTSGKRLIDLEMRE